MLDEMDARLERMARSYAELDLAVASVRITETDRTGAVRVTVDAQGKLLDVVTTSLAGRLPAERIGEVVLGCVHRAQARIADEIAALAGQVVGAGDEMAGHVVATMRDRFPEPGPEPEVAAATRPAPPRSVRDAGEQRPGQPWPSQPMSGAPRVLNIGDIDDTDAEPGLPPRHRPWRGVRRA